MMRLVYIILNGTSHRNNQVKLILGPLTKKVFNILKPTLLAET